MALLDLIIRKTSSSNDAVKRSHSDDDYSTVGTEENDYSTVGTEETDKSREEKHDVISSSNSTTTSATQYEFSVCGLEQWGFYGAQFVLESDDTQSLKLPEPIPEESPEQYADTSMHMEQAEPYAQEEELAKQRVLEFAQRLLARRGLSIRQQLRELLQHESASLIQARVRGMGTRSLVKRQTSAATCIQGEVRRFLEKRRTSAVLLQSQTRAMIARAQRHFLEKRRASAVLLQSQARAMIARDNFTVLVSSVILIQSVTRGFLARNALINSEYDQYSEESSLDDDDGNSSSFEFIDDTPLLDSMFQDFLWQKEEVAEFWQEVGDEMANAFIGTGWFGNKKAKKKAGKSTARETDNEKMQRRLVNESVILIQSRVRGVLLRNSLECMARKDLPGSPSNGQEIVSPTLMVSKVDQETEAEAIVVEEHCGSSPMRRNRKRSKVRRKKDQPKDARTFSC